MAWASAISAAAMIRRPVQVAVGALTLADADRSISEGQIGGIAVSLRIDRHDFDIELFARADHPQCNLTAVGHQDPLKHRRAPVNWESSGTGADRTRPLARS